MEYPAQIVVVGLDKVHCWVAHLAVDPQVEVVGHFVVELAVGLVEKMVAVPGSGLEDTATSEYSEELEEDLQSSRSIRKKLVADQKPSYHAEEDPDSPVEP